MMRWLNYQHFFYFWRVAKTGSVSEACRELRLAQPTISAQLKVFEETLGEKLFVREGRNLKLTEMGKIAFRYAEEVFPTCHEFLDVLEGKDSTVPGKLKIGISDVVPKTIAYRLMEPAFSGTAGTVSCYEDRTERLLAELAISEVDLVIADNPVPPWVKVKAYNHFLGECGVSFLAEGSLARQYRRSFPHSLSGAPLLLPTEEAAVRREIDRWLESQDITPKRVAEFQDSALMKIVAREGKGIIPVPSVVEAEIKREFHLEAVARTDEVKERFYLISVEKRLKNPLVKSIVEWAQKKLFPAAER
jgi:LysR family transcriptional regulator, transcriptional activator of nhaA